MHSSSGFYSDAWCTTDQCSRPPCSSQLSGTQQNPHNFMGCLVHAELIEHISDGQVSHIIGLFNHNPGCSSVVLTRIPLIPLHPHVMRSCSNSCTVVQGMLVLIQGTLFLLITSMILSVAAIHSKNLDDKEQCILWHMDPKISHNASNI